jgi:hypothetical protein
MVLRLAAWRLTHGPRPEPPLPALPAEDGLCALLAHAQALGLPQRDPWDVPDLEQETSFSALLREARLAAREQEGQAC